MISCYPDVSPCITHDDQVELFNFYINVHNILRRYLLNIHNMQRRCLLKNPFVSFTLPIQIVDYVGERFHLMSEELPAAAAGPAK